MCPPIKVIESFFLLKDTNDSPSYATCYEQLFSQKTSPIHNVDTMTHMAINYDEHIHERSMQENEAKAISNGLIQRLLLLILRCVASYNGRFLMKLFGSCFYIVPI
jgi:hypothetical protein